MPRRVTRLHKHKGLVLAFLLIINRITHASLYIPVKMPSKSTYRLKGAGIKHTKLVAHNALLNHTPTGYSSDKN